MLKKAFYGSFCNRRLLRPFLTAYEHSGTRRFFAKASYYGSQSVIGRGLNKFVSKRPAQQNSAYQKAMDTLSSWISCITEPMNRFFARLLEGSKIYGVIKSAMENKEGITTKFIIMLFLAYVIVILGLIMGDRLSFALRLLILAVYFAFIFILAKCDINAIINNSLFMKLLTKLVK